MSESLTHLFTVRNEPHSGTGCEFSSINSKSAIIPLRVLYKAINQFDYETFVSSFYIFSSGFKGLP
jgi:hypothetical protein